MHIEFFGKLAAVLGAIWLIPAVASAQELPHPGGGGFAGPPSGFLMQVDLAATTPIGLDTDSGPLGYLFVPRLSVGGQFGPLSIGGRVAVNVAAQGSEFDGDESKTRFWGLDIGPFVDFEIWSRGRGAIYLLGALPLAIAGWSTESGGDDDSDTSFGFIVDLALGGRFYIARQLSLAIQMGSNLDAQFWSTGSGDSEVKQSQISWMLYGALVLRFVAGS